jgi:hypothetical protein
MLFAVRPYAYDFMRAIQPFFEIIAFSNLGSKVLKQVIQNLENTLNSPVQEYLENMIRLSKVRFGSEFEINGGYIPDKKTYFSYIINKDYMIDLKEQCISLPNLLLLTANRDKRSVIYVSAEPFSICCAINLGFLVIPLLEYIYVDRNDFQLNLIENYILKNRHLKGMTSKFKLDFQFIIQQDAVKSG